MTLNHYSNGFSLIELMIVVAIIGVLSAIAIPGYSGYIKKSEITSALATLKGLVAPAEGWHLENGKFSVSDSESILNQIGSHEKANPLGTLQFSAEDTLQFTFGNQSQFSESPTIKYIRTPTGWKCRVSHNDLKTKGCSETEEETN